MQPARIKPHAKEHTNNPVQKPNFRGHAAGDVEVTRACGRLPPQAREPRQTIIPACNLQVLSPTREEHTNNPVQKPNFRGHWEEGRRLVQPMPNPTV